MRAWIVLAVTLLTSGCAHSLIMPMQSNGPLKTYPPTDPMSVGIYRVTKPYPAYDQIGLISYQTNAYNLNALYQQIRKDAAAAGAMAVVDVKISGEHHVEVVPEQRCEPRTHCDSSGNCWTDQVCHTEDVAEEVSTYTISGTLIREKTQ